MRHDAELRVVEVEPSKTKIDEVAEHWAACMCLVELESEKPRSELPIRMAQTIRPGWPRDYVEAVAIAWSSDGDRKAVCRMTYPLAVQAGAHPQYLLLDFWGDEPRPL